MNLFCSLKKSLLGAFFVLLFVAGSFLGSVAPAVAVGDCNPTCPHAWGENDRKGEIGDIFKYDNPYNGDTEYFKLVNLGSDGRYWYFPTDKTNNGYWEYLDLHAWGENDRKGKIGQIFKYDNPYNGDTEYFKLVNLGSDERYWYFPTDKTNNGYWEYLGPHAWGENDRKGEIGQSFKYDNPYNGDTEYFKLVNLGSDGRYWYFPTDKTNNGYWDYLGTEEACFYGQYSA
ncbi:MAG: hypothetical protein F6J90_16665 [Moorea sp. SIOASIH]|uniref:hypothetical protein n=1 Tax=Moorena sp. SIOASIH TaxID=2607817 RepID=UPI0013BE52B5|nr:hypothetical protein [Moorena sp. SIOASIH]NEO37871.1 hypothetical protein [Moorena sp. SIOASIH]NEO91769.1 hypothetical protein [Moorena sp. SIO3G5]